MSDNPSMCQTVNGLFDLIVDDFRRIGVHASALGNHGLDREMVLDELSRRFADENDESSAIFEAWRSGQPRGDEQIPLVEYITRELAAAPGGTLECHLLLMGLPNELAGALAWGPNGTLRMMRRLTPPGGAPISGEVKMVEQFFDPMSVVCIAFERTVTVELPRIVTS